MVVFGKPARLKAMGEGPAAEPPRFTQLSVDPRGLVLCALDQGGALFACGPMFRSPTGGWARPIRLDAPPRPVRQVFAAHAGAGPDGVLAVLQDGTVWSVTRRERLLPGVSAVQGLRWGRGEGHTVRLIVADGREVPLPDPGAAAI